MINFREIFKNGLTEDSIYEEINYRNTYAKPLYHIFSDISIDKLRELRDLVPNYHIEDLKRGYHVCNSRVGATHIEKIDELDSFKDDTEASLAAESDGYVFIRELAVDESHPCWDMYLDTPENWEILTQYGLV